MRKTLFTLLVLVCGAALADGAALLRSSDYLTTAQEATLTPDEAKRVAFHRSKPQLTRGASVVSLNLAALDSGILTIVLPDGKTSQFIGTKGQRAKDGTAVWQGRSTGGGFPPGRALIALSEDGVAGEIHELGKVYKVISLNPSRQMLVEIVPRPFREPEPKASKPQSKASGRVTPLGGGTPTIRIFTVYSTDAAAYLSVLSAETAAQIAQLNQSFSDSGATLAVESAGYLVTSHYGYTVTVEAATQRAPADPQVLLARDHNLADVVMIVVAIPGDGIAGFAAQIYASEETAFAAVQVSALSDYGYMHEFGHLVGAQHQYSGGPSRSNYTGSFPHTYAHGYQVNTTTPTAVFCFHTIMAYEIVAPCPPGVYDVRIPYWSNTSIPLWGQTIGSSIAQNALVLTNEGPRMVDFHGTRLSPPVIEPVINAAVLFLFD